MQNTQHTLKLALAAAALGATGAQAAIVTGVPQGSDPTSVALPGGSAVSLEAFGLSSDLWFLDADASGAAQVGALVSAGTLIDGSTGFSSGTNIDKVNQSGTPAFVLLVNGTDLLLPFEVQGNGHEDYGYVTFEAQATAAGPTSYKIDSFAYDDSGAAIVAGSVSAVPEPASFTLLAAGVLGLAAYRRRQNASRA